MQEACVSACMTEHASLMPMPKAKKATINTKTEQPRRVFGMNEDEILLRQVLSDLPFQAQDGELSSNWQTTVNDHCCQKEEVMC
jgi:hypothetical protein